MPGRGENGEDVHPSPNVVFKAVKEWGKAREKRGRKRGWRKISGAEDKSIVKTCKQVRKPLGKKVTSKTVRLKLPKKLREKICDRTMRHRLAAVGIKPKRKLRNSNRGPAWMKRRKLWCGTHKNKTPGQWREYLQAVADFKNFPSPPPLED